MKQYVIVKKNNRYHLRDIFFEELNESYGANNVSFRKTKDNKLYIKVTREVLDEWYADIGKITHQEHDNIYIGKIVFESGDIEEVALEYARLVGGISDD